MFFYIALLSVICITQSLVIMFLIWEGLEPIINQMSKAAKFKELQGELKNVSPKEFREVIKKAIQEIKNKKHE